MSGIKRTLPNNSFQAAVNATSPSAANPFVTASELPTSENLGTNDLTSTSKIRKYTLFGDNSDSYLGIYSSSGGVPKMKISGSGEFELSGASGVSTFSVNSDNSGFKFPVGNGNWWFGAENTGGGVQFTFGAFKDLSFEYGTTLRFSGCNFFSPSWRIPIRSFGNGGIEIVDYDGTKPTFISESNGGSGWNWLRNLKIGGSSIANSQGSGLEIEEGDYKVGYSGLHSYIMGGGLITDGFAWKTSAGVEVMKLDGTSNLKLTSPSFGGGQGISLNSGNIEFGSITQVNDGVYSMVLKGYHQLILNGGQGGNGVQGQIVLRDATMFSRCLKREHYADFNYYDKAYSFSVDAIFGDPTTSNMIEFTMNHYGASNSVHYLGHGQNTPITPSVSDIPDRCFGMFPTINGTDVVPTFISKQGDIVTLKKMDISSSASTSDILSLLSNLGLANVI